MIVFPFWKNKGLVSIAYTNINNTINTSFFPFFFGTGTKRGDEILRALSASSPFGA